MKQKWKMGKYIQGQTKKKNIVKRTGVLVYTIK